MSNKKLKWILICNIVTIILLICISVNTKYNIDVNIQIDKTISFVLTELKELNEVLDITKRKYMQLSNYHPDIPIMSEMQSIKVEGDVITIIKLPKNRRCNHSNE